MSMETVIENLAKLIEEAEREDIDCGIFPYVLAKYLVEHGVTIQDATDTNVGDKWVSVDERLPNEEELERSPYQVFLVCVSGEVRSAIYNDIGEYFAKNRRLYGVTHWRELPEPPKGVQ